MTTWDFPIFYKIPFQSTKHTKAPSLFVRNRALKIRTRIPPSGYSRSQVEKDVRIETVIQVTL